MKNVFLLLLIFCLGAAGCPSPEDVELTPEDEAVVIKTALRVMGVRTEVFVEDANNNGVLDVYIVHKNKDKELSEARRIWLMASVTGVIAGSLEGMAREFDLVYIDIHDGIYAATVEDCLDCLDSGANKAEECIEDIWIKVDNPGAVP